VAQFEFLGGLREGSSAYFVVKSFRSRR